MTEKGSPSQNSGSGTDFCALLLSRWAARLASMTLTALFGQTVGLGGVSIQRCLSTASVGTLNSNSECLLPQEPRLLTAVRCFPSWPPEVNSYHSTSICPIFSRRLLNYFRHYHLTLLEHRFWQLFNPKRQLLAAVYFPSFVSSLPPKHRFLATCELFLPFCRDHTTLILPSTSFRPSFSCLPLKDPVNSFRHYLQNWYLYTSPHYLPSTSIFNGCLLFSPSITFGRSIPSFSTRTLICGKYMLLYRQILSFWLFFTSIPSTPLDYFAPHLDYTLDCTLNWMLD